MRTRTPGPLVQRASVFRSMAVFVVVIFSVTVPSHVAHGDDVKPAASAKKRERPIRIQAYITLNSPQGGVLAVEATPKEGWHFPSITQKKGGPRATRVRLEPSEEYRLRGKWKASRPPQVKRYDDIWLDLDVEEHHEPVKWTVPIEFAEDVDPTKVVVKGNVRIQVDSPYVGHVFRIEISALVIPSKADK